MSSSIAEICSCLPKEVWNRAAKAGSDMGWRSWWNLRWYTHDGLEIDGWRAQAIRGVGRRESPYKRSPFGPCASARFGIGHRWAAYFGCDLATASCETMSRFRDNPDLKADDVLEYLRGRSDSGESSEGYPNQYMLDVSARVLDLRRNDNAVFNYIAQANNCEDPSAFARNMMYSRDVVTIPGTQAVALAALDVGFDGIWYRSVRTPPCLLVNSGECLVLFEGREHLLRRFGQVEDSSD